METTSGTTPTTPTAPATDPTSGTTAAGGPGPGLTTGETVETPDGRRVRVTERAAACLPRVRAHLLGLARAGETTTYGALVRDLALPYPAVGVGRLLDLVAADCARRGEPGLDAVVVAAGSAPDPAVARVHRHWRG